MLPNPLKTFVIYANQDVSFREEFESHLRPLVDLAWIENWSDKKILPGDNWDTVIKKQLNETDIFFMLVSVDFYNSGYIRREEFQSAVSSYNAGKAIIIPIIIRPCSWEYYPVIKDLQVLPLNGVAVSDLEYWGIRDKAWENAIQRIADLVENILRERHQNRQVPVPKQAKDGEILSSQNFNKEQPAEFSSESGSEMPLLTDNQPFTGKFSKTASGNGNSDPKMPASEELAAAKNSPALFHVLTNGQTKRDLTDAPEMVFVEGGAFYMGSEAYETEQPIRLVNIPSFWIGKYPVTFEEYDRFCKDTNRKKPLDEDWERGRHPVINVSWSDSKDYCAWLSQKTGQCYRLPSEAEWEFAARGGTRSNNFKFAGSDHLDEIGWYELNSKGKTHSVGEKAPNELDIYDMSGNVWEWCLDFWAKNYNNASLDGSAFMHIEDDGHRVLRGGSWGSMEVNCRVSARNWYFGGDVYIDSGFRLLQTVNLD